jgi:hypothetical protein
LDGEGEFHRYLGNAHLLLVGNPRLLHHLRGQLSDAHLLGISPLAKSFDAELGETDGHQTMSW